MQIHDAGNTSWNVLRFWNHLRIVIRHCRMNQYMDIYGGLNKIRIHHKSNYYFASPFFFNADKSSQVVVAPTAGSTKALHRNHGGTFQYLDDWMVDDFMENPCKIPEARHDAFPKNFGPQCNRCFLNLRQATRNKPRTRHLQPDPQWPVEIGSGMAPRWGYLMSLPAI